MGIRPKKGIKKMKLTLGEIAQALHTKITNPKWEKIAITAAEFNSRKIESGGLFVPLKGARDGHDFLAAAKTNGAAATLWSRPEAPALPYLQVADPLAAFQKLAKYYLQKIQPTVIAITGSNGKTTTKDLSAAVLGSRFKTWKTQGNYNNNVGMPYTILHAPEDTEKLVLEMGMDHFGEIDFLSRLAAPDIAAITLIGESHLEFFGERRGIAQAKMEIVNGLKEDGLLIVPGDEPLLAELLRPVTQEVVQFGMGDEMLHARVVEKEKDGIRFTLNFLPGEFWIPIPGEYNVKNALIAAFIGKRSGVPVEKIRQALQNPPLTADRTEWLHRGGIDILSDVYNANPTAMKLVLDNFQTLETKGKRVAVLGDMLELGSQGGALHQEIAEHLAPDKINEVFLYGTLMAELAAALKTRYPAGKVHYFSTNDQAALIKSVEKALAPGDMVVVKASHGMHLENVIAALTQAAPLG